MKRKLAERNASLSPHNTVRIKEEDLVTDYQQDVKKRSSAASRTGTACDRCRVCPSSCGIMLMETNLVNERTGPQDALRRQPGRLRFLSAGSD